MASKYFHSSSTFSLTVMFCELSAAKIVLLYLLAPLNLAYCGFIFLKDRKSQETAFKNLFGWGSPPIINLFAFQQSKMIETFGVQKAEPLTVLFTDK